MMATLDAGEYVSLYVKRAGQREAAEKARRAQLVTIPVHIRACKKCADISMKTANENAGVPSLSLKITVTLLNLIVNYRLHCG
jgi:hypothetical protein